MHHKLHAPDSSCSWVRTGFDIPGWELLGKGADEGPVTGARESYCIGAGRTESGDLRGSEKRSDEDEPIAVK